MKCRAEELRFDVGDMIYANVGEFTKGNISKWSDETSKLVKKYVKDTTRIRDKKKELRK